MCESDRRTSSVLTKDPLLSKHSGRGGYTASADPLAGVPQELLSAFEAILIEDSYEDDETRALAEQVASMLVLRTLEHQLFDSQTGILVDFLESLEETTDQVDGWLR